MILYTSMHQEQAHEEALSFFLGLQSNLKLYHWTTKSYARHMASDALVSKLGEASDKFLEVYFGKHGRPRMAPGKQLQLRVHKMNDKQAMAYLKRMVKAVASIPAFQMLDSELQSILDDIVAEMEKTLYLFRTS